MVTYINMNNITMKMDRMRLYIFNPYGISTKAWGLFTGVSYGNSSVFLYKTLISPENIPVDELDPAVFSYTAEELKQLKTLHSIRFDPLDIIDT